jgi:DNA-binding transcriptional MocR family regulator
MERQSADLPSASRQGCRYDPDGVLKEGDPLPSVRNVAAEYRVNPLTVLKAYNNWWTRNWWKPGEDGACSSMQGRARCCCGPSERCFWKKNGPGSARPFSGLA